MKGADYYDVFKISADDVIVSQKGSNGDNATLSALIESFFWLDCYSQLYEKDTKQMQNRSMETTKCYECYVCPRN